MWGNGILKKPVKGNPPNRRILRRRLFEQTPFQRAVVGLVGPLVGRGSRPQHWTVVKTLSHPQGVCR